MPWKPTPLEDRLLAKTTISPRCWLWTGAKNVKGYGFIHVGTSRADKKMAQVHRAAWELWVGTIPDGMTLDHIREKCGNRNCIRPDHLEVVSRGENTLRGDGPTAQNARKTHCKRGHEFTPANTYVYKRKNGRTERRCRMCMQDRSAGLI